MNKSSLPKEILIEILMKNYENLNGLPIDDIYRLKKSCDQRIKEEENKNKKILSKKYEVRDRADENKNVKISFNSNEKYITIFSDSYCIEISLYRSHYYQYHLEDFSEDPTKKYWYKRKGYESYKKLCDIIHPLRILLYDKGEEESVVKEIIEIFEMLVNAHMTVYETYRVINYSNITY